MNNQTIDMILSLIASVLAVISVILFLKYVGLEYNLILTYAPVIVWIGWLFEYYLFSRAREKRGCNIGTG